MPFGPGDTNGSGKKPAATLSHSAVSPSHLGVTKHGRQINRDQQLSVAFL